MRLILIAGIDTTWSALGASIWHLATHDDDRRRLVADPSLMDTAIEEFCRINYGVDFPLSTKVDVNGKETHPVFAFLKERAGGRLGTAVKWNFTKFLVAPDGTTVKRYGPRTDPMAISGDIEALLPARRGGGGDGAIHLTRAHPRGIARPALGCLFAWRHPV